ncbi:Panacea domain-containing protein [Xanthobacter autotrophicus]|uniref:Panacea domain-containing protein n=1 Tax=Xanthobacter autotrophicus TaxID=280 RepID=UPI003727AEBF
MPNHSAAAIANEFLKLRNSDTWPQQMLLQKLAYIANGWNLAINGAPLVAEPAEAWDNGPVFRGLWDHIRDFGYRGPGCTLTDPTTGEVLKANLTDSERSIISHVWAKYGPMGAQALSKMTHEPGTPWSNTYFKGGRNSTLDNEDIKQHYTKLALAGRAGKQ